MATRAFLRCGVRRCAGLIFAVACGVPTWSLAAENLYKDELEAVKIEEIRVLMRAAREARISTDSKEAQAVSAGEKCNWQLALDLCSQAAALNEKAYEAQRQIQNRLRGVQTYVETHSLRSHATWMDQALLDSAKRNLPEVDFAAKAIGNDYDTVSATTERICAIATKTSNRCRNACQTPQPEPHIQVLRCPQGEVGVLRKITPYACLDRQWVLSPELVDYSSTCTKVEGPQTPSATPQPPSAGQTQQARQLYKEDNNRGGVTVPLPEPGPQFTPVPIPRIGVPEPGHATPPSPGPQPTGSRPKAPPQPPAAAPLPSAPTPPASAPKPPTSKPKVVPEPPRTAPPPQPPAAPPQTGQVVPKFGGNWLGSGGCGFAAMSITEQGNNLQISGLPGNGVLAAVAQGQIVSLQGVTMFGKPDHIVTLTLNQATLTLQAASNAGSCNDRFHR